MRRDAEAVSDCRPNRRRSGRSARRRARIVDGHPVAAGIGGFGHAPGGADGRAQSAVRDVGDLGMVRAGGDSSGLSLESGQGRIAPGGAAVGGNVNLAGDGGIEYRRRTGDFRGGSGKRRGSPFSLAADVECVRVRRRRASGRLSANAGRSRSGAPGRADRRISARWRRRRERSRWRTPAPGRASANRRDRSRAR